MPVANTENMVGHQISAMKKRCTQHVTRRADKATVRAMKVQGLAMTRKQKTRLIQGAIIPAATAGTLWDIPTRKAPIRTKNEQGYLALSSKYGRLWFKGRRNV